MIQRPASFSPRGEEFTQPTVNPIILGLRVACSRLLAAEFTQPLPPILRGLRLFVFNLISAPSHPTQKTTPRRTPLRKRASNTIVGARGLGRRVGLSGWLRLTKSEVSEIGHLISPVPLSFIRSVAHAEKCENSRRAQRSPYKATQLTIRKARIRAASRITQGRCDGGRS